MTYGSINRLDLQDTGCGVSGVPDDSGLEVKALDGM